MTRRLMLMKLSERNNPENELKANTIHSRVFGTTSHSRMCRTHLGIEEMIYYCIYIFICYISVASTPCWPSLLILQCRSQHYLPIFPKGMNVWLTNEWMNFWVVWLWTDKVCFIFLFSTFLPQVCIFLFRDNELYFQESLCLEKWEVGLNVTEGSIHICLPKIQAHQSCDA